MELLKRRLEDIGKKPIELARHLGVPPARIYELLKGQRRLQTKEIGPTATFLSLPESTVLSWAQGGAEPAPQKPTAPTSRQPILPDDRDAARGLEVWASAEGGEEGAMLISTGPIDYIPRPAGLPVRGSFAVYLLGDSMSPAYDHGDQLYINPNKPIRGGLDCLFIKEMEDGTLMALAKRLVRPTADKWRVKQFNPAKEFDLDRRVWSKAWMVAGKMNRT